jgi:ribonuclease P protein component
MMSERSQLERQKFAKSYRLCCNSDYQYVFSNASKNSDNLFLVLSRKSQTGEARLGLAVAKKHARLAVQRNRIKRIIRESFRLKQKTIPAVDIVVMIRPAAVKANNQQLFSSLEKLWENQKV